jgi:hypothetical protein
MSLIRKKYWTTHIDMRDAFAQNAYVEEEP